MAELNISGLTLGSATPQATGSAAPGTSPLASHQDHVHSSAGGGSLSGSTTFLGADVTGATGALSFTDALTVAVVSTHKYQISAKLHLLSAATIAYVVELYDGTTVLATSEPTASIANANFADFYFPPIDYQPASNVTIHLRFAPVTTASTAPTAKAAADSGGNTATWLTLLTYA